MTEPTTPLRVYRVSEIRDNALRRDHGYHASLDGAFAYCETEERKKPLLDSVRFELAPAPGGTQWLIHVFSGPDDTWPETSDLVISQHDVVQDEAAPAVPLPPADQTARRDRIRRAVCEAEGFMWNEELLEPDEYGEIADAVLAVLPEPTPAADRAAVLREAAAAADQKARTLPAEWGGHEWGDRAAEGARAVAAELRRLADETQPAQPQPEEAHEPLHRWRVEILDGDEWMPCSRTFGARSLAVDRYRSSSERTPAWADGEPVQRRLVRETTTYTVEAEHASALEPRQDGAGS